MYSKEFMKFLMGYQKDDFKPQETKKEIRFKNTNKKGCLATIALTVKK